VKWNLDKFLDWAGSMTYIRDDVATASPHSGRIVPDLDLRVTRGIQLLSTSTILLSVQLHRPTSIEFPVEGLATANMTLAAHVGADHFSWFFQGADRLSGTYLLHLLYRSTRTRSSMNCVRLPNTQAPTTSSQVMRSRARHLIPRDMRAARRFPSSVSPRSAPCPRPWRRCSRTS
jgi:hypothetical protein